MRDSKSTEPHRLMPSTVKAMFLLLVMLCPMERAWSQSPPTGPAGGDLSGTYPNPTLATDRVRKTGDTMTGGLNITIPALQSAGLVLQRSHNQVGSFVSQYFTLNNSNNTPMIYAGIAGGILNSTAGSEAGALRFFTFTAGPGFTERAVLDNIGNFGIGTATPGYKLDVAGQVRSTTGGFVFPDATVQATAASGIFKNIANAAGVLQFSAGSNNDALRFEGAGGTSVSFDAANKKVTITGSGGSSGWTDGGANVNLTSSSANVGVGTSTPAAKLHVYSPGNTYLRIGAPLASQSSIALNDDTNGQDIVLYRPEATRDFSLWTATAGSVVYVTQAGSVGIGTGTPLTKLHVAGGTRIDGSGRVYLGTGAVANYRGLEIIEENATTFSIRHHDPGVAWRNIALNPFGGNVGIGNLAPNSQYKLDVTGNANVTGDFNATGTVTGGTINAKYQDVAEWVESSQSIPAGTVVVLDHTKTNQVVASTKAYDMRVAGVISSQPGITLGERGEGRVLVATTGRVRVKVDATEGPIQVGDLLVTAEKEGFAMKSVPVSIGGVQLHRPGTLIGKALEPLAKGTGEILVLLSLQ